MAIRFYTNPVGIPTEEYGTLEHCHIHEWNELINHLEQIKP